MITRYYFFWNNYWNNTGFLQDKYRHIVKQKKKKDSQASQAQRGGQMKSSLLFVIIFAHPASGVKVI